MEVRVEAVDGAVDAHSDHGVAHLVEEGCDAGGHQVSRAAGHALADVSHIGAVLVVCMR